MADIVPDGQIHSAPVVNSDLVVTNDTTIITMNPLKGGITNPRGFMCNVAGTIVFDDLDDTESTWTILAGVIYPVCVKRIKTGSTATGIHVVA